MPDSGFSVLVDRHLKYNHFTDDYESGLDENGKEKRTVTITCNVCGYNEVIKSVDIKDGKVVIK